jgi:hypothetical protein
VYRRYHTTIKRYPNFTYDRIQPAPRDAQGEIPDQHRLLDVDGIIRSGRVCGCVCVWARGRGRGNGPGT